MCLTLYLSQDSSFISPARLVWDEFNLDRPLDAPKKTPPGLRKPKPQPLSAGEEPEQQANLVEEGVSIDPGRIESKKTQWEERLPDVANIIADLKKVESEHFWEKPLTNLDEDVKRQLHPLLRDIQEAILYKAIVENWDWKTLHDTYGTAMDNLYTKCATRPTLYELYGDLMRFWTWLKRPEKTGMEGENKYLKGRKISVTEKGKIMTQLEKLEQQARMQVTCLDYDADSKACNKERPVGDEKGELDQDQLDFVQEQLLRFYKNYSVNKAIVLDRPTHDSYKEGIPDDIRREYYGILLNLYSSCIRKMDKK